MSRLIPLILAAACALASNPVLAQEADPSQAAIAAIEKMLVQRPADPTLFYYLSSFQARTKQREKALASMQKVAELGDGFLPGKDFGFEHMLDDAAFQALRATMEKSLPVVASAPVAFRLEDKTLAPEGIAYDPVGKHFYIGSVAQKKLLRVSPKGVVSVFSREDDELQQILGVAVDARRRALYAVSTNALTQSKPLVNAVVRYDLRTGKRSAAYRVLDAQQLNDVAIAPNGDLYTSDSRSGAIFRIPASHPVPVALVAPGTLGGTNGIAVSADGKTLYAAHSTGVVRIDTATGKFEKMLPPPRQTVAAIDGLYLVRGDLVGIQNITNPGRVIRLRLDAKGREILRVDTLQSHHNPAFDQPTTGALNGQDLYVLGTTQVGRFNDKGELEDPASLKQPLVVRIPLGK